MGEKKTTAVDKAFAALLHEDDAKAMEALATIQDKGDATAILPLLHALAATGEPARQRRIQGLLFQVKAKDAAAELARALDIPELLDVRKTAIAAFWNAGLDASPYTVRLVQIAVEGDAEEAFEVLTVIENLDALPEQTVKMALQQLGQALLREQDAYKHTLLKDLQQVLSGRSGAAGEPETH